MARRRAMLVLLALAAMLAVAHAADEGKADGYQQQ